MTRRILWLRFGQSAALLCGITGAVLLSEPAHWQPAWLVIGILVFSLISEPVPLQFKNVAINGAFCGIVVAAVIAGPGPAVLIGVVTMIQNAVRRRLPLTHTLANVSTHAFFPLVAWIIFSGLDGPAHVDRPEIMLIPIVVGAFVVANALNFLLIAIDVEIADGQPSVRESVQRMYFEMFPAELASSLLTAMVAFAYLAYGSAALILLGVLALVFQHLMRMALSAAQRREEVEERNAQLASLQMGLVSTMLKTLALRDPRTARHSTAVARYAREMAKDLDLPEHKQESIHTAALFHDIGKFIFPDSILMTDSPLTDEEYEIVRRHPEVGAELIEQLDGYQDVADMVRWHHERIDGRGYPDYLTGADIPIGARIIAVADVYDVITARDTYRCPVSPAEAFDELRTVAGSQLDAQLVELFIGIIQSRGVQFRHGTADDFEAELALERRLRDYAAPRPVAA